ncbi:hypothetical protein J6590_074993 [Homalodisca vitripennis]|nr:hypothetical protein J6590_074993 [Homalodisca vitripennis]
MFRLAGPPHKAPQYCPNLGKSPVFMRRSRLYNYISSEHGTIILREVSEWKNIIQAHFLGVQSHRPKPRREEHKGEFGNSYFQDLRSKFRRGEDVMVVVDEPVVTKFRTRHLLSYCYHVWLL